MYSTVTWHDGSPISAADFVMGMITLFDLAKEDSPYFDEALVPGLQQFQAAFKGFRIASTDPLVIEHWGDNPSLDAENTPYTWWPNATPQYPYGSAAWHNMAIMLRGEGNGSIAFTADKAAANEVEQTNMIAGPSLDILAGELISATEESWIPYAPTMSQYVTAEDAVARYNNLAEFARRYGHYYIGTGVYFLSGVFPVEHQAVLSHYAAHPDLASRYAGFGAPVLATTEIDGPARVVIGEEAAFDVFVDTPEGEPYAAADVGGITYLLFDATGAQVSSGEAEPVEDGVWQVVLPSDVTGALAEGSNRLEVVVTSNIVALPGLGSFEFVTAP
jgi:peptide/nickel transport system substrate-binding protein